MQGNVKGDTKGESGWLASEFINEDDMRRAAAQRLGVPFVLLAREDIVPEALVFIPEPLARAHSMVAYHMQNGALEVALLDIADLEKITSLHPGKKIKPRLTNQASIKQALMVYQKHLKDTFGAGLQTGDADALILHALLHQASDIHLDVSPSGTRVRYRIQGALHEAMRLSVEAGSVLVQNIKQLAKLFPIAVMQEGKFKIERSAEPNGDGETIMVSVANVPGVEGEKLTMRLARERVGQQGFTLSALGLHGKGLEQVHAMLHARSGLVLVCGPYGSGKTTVLYTLLDQLHGGERAIATVEDSIEYRLPHAIQTKTRPEVGLTMLAGLRAVLRSDPDIVLVGDMSDAEVAQLALEAAARGVLVLASIDARSASRAIAKLLSWGISPRLIASQMLGVISQRLAKKLAEDKEPESADRSGRQKLSREEAAALEGSANFGRILAALKDEGHLGSHVAWKDVTFYRGEEHKGLLGVQEVLAVTSVIKEIIVQSGDADDLEAEARKEGMLTLVEDALFKAAAGLMSLNESLEVAGE